MSSLFTQKQPTYVDVYLGEKIKSRRLFLKQSQGELGKQVGLTFQQIQKYERGVNRISINRLISFSTALKVPLSYFIDKNLLKEWQDKTAVLPDPIVNTEILSLIRAYTMIEDPILKKQLLKMAQSLSKSNI